MSSFISKEEKYYSLVKKAKESGVKTASLDIFNFAENIKLSEQVSGLCEFTNEIYFELLKKIKEMPISLQKKCLDYFKNNDVIENQLQERENPILIPFYAAMERVHAIDFLIKNEGKIEDKEFFIKLHDVLMRGTEKGSMSHLREEDNCYVGHRDANNEIVFSFFPLLVKDIPDALEKLITVYNKKYSDDDIFIKPIIIHGIISALQLFQDGNTRLSRLIEYVMIWKNTNEFCVDSFSKPVVYASKSYKEYYKEYRDLVASLVIKGDNEAWNEWIKFNLKRIQDTIFLDNYLIDEFNRRESYGKSL